MVTVLSVVDIVSIGVAVVCTLVTINANKVASLYLLIIYSCSFIGVSEHLELT